MTLTLQKAHYHTTAKEYTMEKTPSIYCQKLYNALSSLILSKEDSLELEYPQYLSNGIVMMKPSPFAEKNKLGRICRCGVQLRLKEQWWNEGNGCIFHPLRVKCGTYLCCGKMPGSAGCEHSKYHVYNNIPTKNCRFFTPTPAQSKWQLYINNQYVTVCSVPINCFALDCEFLYTCKGMEVCRVSLVSFDGNEIYDHIVKPKNLVIDCNTRFSGIVLSDLDGPNVLSLSQVQEDLKKIINASTILIGHSLNSDLKALQMAHDNVIDVAALFPHPRGFPYRNSLQRIVEKELGITIHAPDHPHDSVQDAEVCLALLMKFPDVAQSCKDYCASIKMESLLS